MVITGKNWTWFYIHELNFLRIPAKSNFIPAKLNQFIYENNFNKAPDRHIVIAMIISYVFAGSYAENPFWYQQFDVRQFILARVVQANVVDDAADNCHL